MKLDVPISASKLKSYERCPEMFKLKYMDRKAPEGGESVHLQMGDAVHNAIEAVLKDETPVDDEALLRDRFKAEYRDMDYDLDDEYHDKVLRCFNSAAKYLADREPTITGVELPVEYHIGAEGVDHDAMGFVDVTTESKVVDWKTGKSEGKTLDETLQGSVYMAGYQAYFGRPPEQIQFVYLDESKVRTLEPSDEVWDTMVEKARSLMTAIDEDHFPAKPDDSKCYWCSFEVHCSTSQVGGGGIDWEAYP